MDPSSTQANQVSLDTLRNGGALVPQQGQQVVRAGFFDLQGFELLQRVAKAFASSSLVPAQYQGNLANCMIALNLARRLQADELMVMQNLYIVHGNPGWSSKFLIACVNTSGRFNALRYEWRGQPGTPEHGCRAWTIEKATGDRLDGAWVDWKMVRAEKWDAKNGSKWLTMPEQMFIYRSAAFWQRAYAPEISMGLPTAEELADVIDVRADGSYTVTTEALRADMARVDADGVIEGAGAGAGAVAGQAAPDEVSGQATTVDPVTYAQVADLIAKATTPLEVQAAQALVEKVEDAEQQCELNAKAEQRIAELKPKAATAPKSRRAAAAPASID